MRRPHLLTGHAGSGKTTLMQMIAANHVRHNHLVLTAPTHKACEVLARKLRLTGVSVPVQTIHSLLSLRPKHQGDKQVFVRGKHAKAIAQQIVIIDEASMLDSSMMQHIGRWLNGRAVIFCGDPAQLPPIGETETKAFDTVPASHLHGIVRQAEGNPIIAASAIIRACQEMAPGQKPDDLKMDWSWTAPVRVGDTGIFRPGAALDEWMKKGFCSEAFANDPDAFRYLCWTNDRVGEINAKVRRWLGHDVNVPFEAGERALIRSPYVVADEVLISTNEEVTVMDMGMEQYLGIPAWHVKVMTNTKVEHEIHIPADMDAYKMRLAALADDAKGDSGSWDDYHEFKAGFVQAQAVYAFTIHQSQGSTFKRVFLDIQEIRKWMRRSPLEALRGAYVGVTRASHALILAGI